MEDVLQTITYLYRKQDIAFKFNIWLAYLLRRPIYEYEYNNEGKIIRVIRQLGYEYWYISAQYNNSLFEYPETIDNNATLNKVLFV